MYNFVVVQDKRYRGYTIRPSAERKKLRWDAEAVARGSVGETAARIYTWKEWLEFAASHSLDPVESLMMD